MKSYQIVYAVAVRGSLQIETIDFTNEADARVAMGTLRNRAGRDLSRVVISATLAGPDDEVIEEYDA